MELRTVITTRPRSHRTSLGDVVTVRKVVEDDGFLWESITLECPLELTAPGKSWPERNAT